MESQQKSKSTDGTMDLKNYYFADVCIVPTFPTFATTEHRYIGSPKHADRTTPNVGTPIHELRERANAVCAAMSSNLPRPPIVDASLTGRERDIALEAERDCAANNKDVFLAISAMSKNIVVRDDIKAEVAEALQPVAERLVDVEEGMTKLETRTSNLTMIASTI